MERAKERVRDTEVKKSKTRSKQVAKLCLMFQALISAVLQGQLIYPNCLYLLFRMFYFSIFFPNKNPDISLTSMATNIENGLHIHVHWT